MERESPTSKPGPPPSDRELHWVAGVMTVLTAAVVVGLLLRASQGALWGPMLGWLIAGAVAGAILRRRNPAMKVAVIAALAAGLITALINVLVLREPPPSTVRPHAVAETISVSTMLLSTLACALASVVGAAGVVELTRDSNRS